MTVGNHRFRVVAVDSYGATGTGVEHSITVEDARAEITVLSGDDQTTAASQLNALPFELSIWNKGHTQLLTNMRVLFSVVDGGGLLAANASGASLNSILEQRTDTNGRVIAYYKQPTAAYVLSEIRVAAGTTTATLFSQSTAPGDLDGNGLQDAWEMANFGRTGVDPTLDPDNDGLNTGQEQLRGTNPHNADSDGDGVDDGQETLESRDPLQKGDDAPLPVNCQLVIKMPDGSYKGVTRDWQVVPVTGP